jgi:hypothetical protein
MQNGPRPARRKETGACAYSGANHIFCPYGGRYAPYVWAILCNANSPRLAGLPRPRRREAAVGAAARGVRRALERLGGRGTERYARLARGSSSDGPKALASVAHTTAAGLEAQCAASSGLSRRRGFAACRGLGERGNRSASSNLSSKGNFWNCLSISNHGRWALVIELLARYRGFFWRQYRERRSQTRLGRLMPRHDSDRAMALVK